MVYKHRMNNGRIKHYASKEAYQRSLKGFFANGDKPTSSKRKVAKAQAKSKTKSKPISKPSVSGKKKTKAQEKAESKAIMREIVGKGLPIEYPKGLKEQLEASEKREPKLFWKAEQWIDAIGKANPEELKQIEMDYERLGKFSNQISINDRLAIERAIKYPDQANKTKNILESQYKHHTEGRLQDLKKADNLVDIYNVEKEAKEAFDDGSIGWLAHKTIKEAIEEKIDNIELQRRKPKDVPFKEKPSKGKVYASVDEAVKSEKGRISPDKNTTVSELMNNVKSGLMSGNNDWEKRFIKSVSEKYFKNGSMSPKQLAVLRRIESGTEYKGKSTGSKTRKKKVPKSKQGYRYFASSNKASKPKEIWDFDAKEIMEGKQIKDKTNGSFWQVIWKVPKKLNKPTSLRAIGYSGFGGMITKVAGLSNPDKEVKTVWIAKNSKYKYKISNGNMQHKASFGAGVFLGTDSENKPFTRSEKMERDMNRALGGAEPLSKPNMTMDELMDLGKTRKQKISAKIKRKLNQ